MLLKARSGDEALELLLRHDVALALIDVQMPGLNGFELAELMRGRERTRRIPIIFVTAGTADNQRRFRGYEAGAVDFIQKPIESDILRSKADVFFELYRQRQQIAAQRDELAAQAEALRQADRRKDEFLATLAHELRNPLAPLRYGLDVLRKDPDGHRVASIRATMDRQLAHLVRLIDDLLDVSRVSQGKITLRKERLQAADVVRAAVEASQPVIDAARHSLKIDLSAAPVWLEGDITRLSQVVGNLLNNAAKYTPEGGGIRLSVHAEGNAAVIEVSDNGIGIPFEMQARVFQLFTQVDKHLDRAQGGLGIGLALVKQLVTLHGGTIKVESAAPAREAPSQSAFHWRPRPSKRQRRWNSAERGSRDPSRSWWSRTTWTWPRRWAGCSRGYGTISALFMRGGRRWPRRATIGRTSSSSISDFQEWTATPSAAPFVRTSCSRTYRSLLKAAGGRTTTRCWPPRPASIITSPSR